MEGILLVNKPKGKTSFSLIHELRKITGVQKIGHSGTLDPFATGVMVLLIGKKFTKKSQTFTFQDKEYIARVHLGFETETYDSDSEKIAVSDRIPEKEEIEKALEQFQGEVEQTPPMFSAKKVKGVRLYKLARQGVEIERPKKIVSMTTTMLGYEYPYLDIHVRCSKGTYIRSIAYDLGKVLGVGAYLSELKRTAQGPFRLDQCLDYEKLCDCKNHLVTPS